MMDRSALHRALLRLYPSVSDGPEVYAAFCCGRASLSRTPQTACRTCTGAPTVTVVRSEAELLTWADTLPLPTPPTPPPPT